MKKIFFTLAFVAVALVSFTTVQKTEKIINDTEPKSEITYAGNVDVATSVLLWKGSKPTGSHNGTVMLKEGSILVKRGKLKGGTFVIDMSTIQETGGGKRLVGHLSSSDFFDVKVFPTSKFVITKVKKKGGKLAVTGDLTIKDVTKSITIPANITVDGDVITFKSETFEVNRADYNVKYGSKSFFDNLKDKFINDMMELSFEVKAAK